MEGATCKTSDQLDKEIINGTEFIRANLCFRKLKIYLTFDRNFDDTCICYAWQWCRLKKSHGVSGVCLIT